MFFQQLCCFEQRQPHHSAVAARDGGNKCCRPALNRICASLILRFTIRKVSLYFTSGKTLRYLVPDSALNYIAANNLYSE